MRNWLFELFRIQQHLIDLEHNGFSLEHISSRFVVNCSTSCLVHLQLEDELRALDLITISTHANTFNALHASDLFVCLLLGSVHVCVESCHLIVSAGCLLLWDQLHIGLRVN